MACDVNIGMCADGSRARKEITKTQKTAKGFGKNAGKAFGNIAKAAGLAGAAMLALTKTVKFIKGSIASVSEFEVAVAKLDNVIRATGGAAGLTTMEMLKMADELQLLSTVSNTTAIEAQGVLATFRNIGREVFPEALTIAADMSEMFGQDLRQSMVQLGIALNDPERGFTRLQRIGITFTEQQKELIGVLQDSGDIMGAQGIILDELKAQFGGAALAARQTFGGSIKALKNNFSDLQRQVGLLITQESGLGDFIDMMNTFLEVPENMRNIIRAFQIMGATAVTAFKFTIFAIKLTLDTFALMWFAVRDIGEILKVVFNPENWKPGRMKKAIAEVTFGSVEVVKKMKDDIIQLGLDTAEAFAGALDPNLPELLFEPTTNALNGVTNAVNENEDAINSLVIEYKAGYFPAMSSMSDMTMMYTESVRENSQALIDNQTAVAESKTLMQEFGLTAQFASDTFATAWTTSLETAFTTTKSFSGAMKSLLKNMFADLFLMLGRQLAIASVGYLLSIPPMFGRAALAAGLSATAFAASSAVRGMQLGGVVPGTGFGDSQMAMLEPGETVIRKEVARDNAPAIAAMNAGEGAGMLHLTLNLDGQVFYDGVTQASKDGRLFIDANVVGSS